MHWSLKYIPEWFPGAGFQKKAREWKDLQHRFHNEAFNMAKSLQMYIERIIPSVCLENIEGRSDAEHHKEIVKDFAPLVFAGRQLAYTIIIWMFVATVASIFDVEEAEDEDGNKIKPSGKHYSGLIRKPLPFKCKLKPRSEAAKDTLSSMADII
ncbi:hypothetical protein CVT24_005082 [Panaeolus cyanescens]|uniref:Uncharacterized protein n=1 Tax=Panaeolus cyanescens TaxID=181874 RepID=A0A409YB01_9AGAR|nr:hypothetical protein CVT24_005082 [Panaeolus cyanescens]